MTDIKVPDRTDKHRKHEQLINKRPRDIEKELAAIFIGLGLIPNLQQAQSSPGHCSRPLQPRCR